VLKVDGSTVANNAEVGIWNRLGTATITSSTISGNSRGMLSDGTATIVGSQFIANGGNPSFVGGFGALYNGGTMTVRGTTFAGNSGTSGGAIENGYGGSMVVNGCTFTANLAPDRTFSNGFVEQGRGGAIHNSYDLTVRNCTFTGNSATL